MSDINVAFGSTTVAYAGLESLLLNAGANGDTFDVTATHTGTATTINMGQGTNTANAGNGLANLIQGALTLTGSGAPLLDGRVVARGTPIDVIPGPHFVGEGGMGRVIEVAGPMTLALGTSSSTPSASSGITSVGVAEDGLPWGLIAGGAVGVVVVAGVVVGVVIGLNQPDAAPNPDGTTFFVDASKLNAGAP